MSKVETGTFCLLAEADKANPVIHEMLDYDGPAAGRVTKFARREDRLFRLRPGLNPEEHVVVFDALIAEGNDLVVPDENRLGYATVHLKRDEE